MLNIKSPQTNKIDLTLRSFTRERKSVIPSDYVVYLQESDFNVGAVNDPITFHKQGIAKNQIYGSML